MSILSAERTMLFAGAFALSMMACSADENGGELIASTTQAIAGASAIPLNPVADSGGWSNVAQATDGDTSTAADKATTGEEWLEYDLGGSYILSGARLNEDNSGNWNVEDWKVQYWTGSAWQDAFGLTPTPVAGWTEVQFQDIETSRVRFVVTDTSHVEVREVAVLGVPSTCADGIQDSDETGVDCGGSCGSCDGKGPLRIANSAAVGDVQTPSSYAYDSDPGTRFTNVGTLESGDVQFFLEDWRYVTKIRLWMYKGDTRTYPLRVSVDGDRRGSIVFDGSTDPSADYFDINLPNPDLGLSVRVTLTDLNSDGNAWLSIREIEILGYGDYPVCGNGLLETGEQCDDGNLSANDGCSDTCRIEYCGDGIVNGTEQCDDGNQSGGDGCAADCTLEPSCGSDRLVPVGAEATSEEGPFVAENAIDGDANTRWGSNFTDDESITIDLGSDKHVDAVRLDWETAFGKDYDIQVSSDAASWTTVASVRDNADSSDDYLDGFDTTARYVRMQGISRGTGWGYSLYEFDVFGDDDPNCSIPAENLLAGPWEFVSANFSPSDVYTIDGNSIVFDYSGEFTWEGGNPPPPFRIDFDQQNLAVEQGHSYRLTLDIDPGSTVDTIFVATLSGAAGAPSASLTGSGQLVFDFDVTDDPGANPTLTLIQRPIFASVPGTSFVIGIMNFTLADAVLSPND